MTKEEVISFLKQSQEKILNFIAKLETELDKCKKAKGIGPNLKKIKERVTLLAPKVEYARIVKTRLTEINTNFQNGKLEPFQIKPF